MRTWQIVALVVTFGALAFFAGLRFGERGGIAPADGASVAEEASCACEVDAPEGWAEVVAARDEDDVPQIPPKAGQSAVVAFVGEDTDASREVTDLLADLEERIGDEAGVAIVDADVHRDQALQWRLRMVPTLVFLDAEGEEVSRHEGAISEEELLSALRDAGAEVE